MSLLVYVAILIIAIVIVVFLSFEINKINNQLLFINSKLKMDMIDLVDEIKDSNNDLLKEYSKLIHLNNEKINCHESIVSSEQYDYISPYSSINDVCSLNNPEKINKQNQEKVDVKTEDIKIENAEEKTETKDDLDTEDIEGLVNTDALRFNSVKPEDLLSVKSEDLLNESEHINSQEEIENNIEEKIDEKVENDIEEKIESKEEIIDEEEIKNYISDNPKIKELNKICEKLGIDSKKKKKTELINLIKKYFE